MKKIISLLFLLMAIPSALFSQKYYPKASIIADLDSLYKNIDEVHPNMFTVISKPEFEKRLNNIKTSLPDSLNKIEFYKIVAPLMSSLGDGHTGIAFPSKDFFQNDPVILPVMVYYEEHTLKVKYSSNIPAGAEITSINRKPVQKIIDELSKYVSGESKAFRIARLVNGFHILYRFIDNSSSFCIKYRHNNSSKVVKIDGQKFSEAKKQDSEARSREAHNNSTFQYAIIDSISTAVFRFDQFKFENGHFNKFIDSMFTDIKDKNISNLIIDLRYNGGGDSQVGDAIFQYISRVPFAQFGSATIKISDLVKSQRQGEKRGNGIYNLKVSPDQLNQLKDCIEPKFRGNLYLLTSDITSSSAKDFAWAFHYFKMGTIVGQETGGWIVAFGDIIYQKLPNTQMDYTTSYKLFYGYGATDAERHGVIPDIKIPSEQALKKTLELISEKQKNK